MSFEVYVCVCLLFESQNDVEENNCEKHFLLRILVPIPTSSSPSMLRTGFQVIICRELEDVDPAILLRLEAAFDEVLMIKKSQDEMLGKGNDTNRCNRLCCLLLLPQRQRVSSGIPLLTHSKSYSLPESSPVTDYDRKAVAERTE